MRALEKIMVGKFKDGQVLTAKQLNVIIFALRALARKTKKRARR